MSLLHSATGSPLIRPAGAVMRPQPQIPRPRDRTQCCLRSHWPFDVGAVRSAFCPERAGQLGTTKLELVSGRSEEGSRFITDVASLIMAPMNWALTEQ